MRTLRGLRAQMLLWTILPLILILVAVSFGSITLHQRSMRDMVARRDAQLVELAAARLNGGLKERVLVLQTLLAPTPDTATPLAALAGARSLLTPFDRGIRVFNLSASPPSGPAAPLASLAADKTVLDAAVARPGRPTVVLTTGADGSVLALIGLTDPPSQWAALGVVSARALNMPALLRQLSGEGWRAAAFLVDVTGRVIYHSDPALVGQDLRDHVGIADVIQGRAGARFARQAGADEHVFGYAPVLLAGWGLVIEEPWRDVVVPMLQYTLLAPLIVLAAAVTSLVALYFSLRRVIRPLHVLGRFPRDPCAGWRDWRDRRSPPYPPGNGRANRPLPGRHAGLHRGVDTGAGGGTPAPGAGAARRNRTRVDRAIAAGDDARVRRGGVYQRAVCRGRTGHPATSGRSVCAAEAIAAGRAPPDSRPRPVYLEELGLVSALEMLTTTIRQDGLSAGFDVTGDETSLVVGGGARRLPDRPGRSEQCHAPRASDPD
jgi:hypothetical protein